jgi:hypothetical protein
MQVREEDEKQNIKIDFREIGYGWEMAELAQDRVQCWAFVLPALNLRSATRELDNLAPFCLLLLVSQLSNCPQAILFIPYQTVGPHDAKGGDIFFFFSFRGVG